MTRRMDAHWNSASSAKKSPSKVCSEFPMWEFQLIRKSWAWLTCSPTFPMVIGTITPYIHEAKNITERTGVGRRGGEENKRCLSAAA